MKTKLARIAEIAKVKPKEQFTSLYHLLNKEMLLECHAELDANKATGIDQVSKEEYERNLEENINSLVERLKRKGYRSCHDALKEVNRIIEKGKISYVVDADIKIPIDRTLNY